MGQAHFRVDSLKFSILLKNHGTGCNPEPDSNVGEKVSTHGRYQDPDEGNSGCSLPQEGSILLAPIFYSVSTIFFPAYESSSENTGLSLLVSHMFVL